MIGSLNAQMEESSLTALPSDSGSPIINVAWGLWLAFSSSFSLQEQEMGKVQETQPLPSPSLPEDSGCGIPANSNGRRLFTECAARPTWRPALSLLSSLSRFPCKWFSYRALFLSLPLCSMHFCSLLPLSKCLFANTWNTDLKMFSFFSTRYSQESGCCYYYNSC